MQSDADLSLTRLISAPVARVWRAWSTPSLLARWWIPKPLECQVVKLDLRPGGGFETRMREPGQAAFQPHLEACILAAEPERRLVFTTVLVEGWQPREPWLALTADIRLGPEGTGTRYDVRVLHRTAADRDKHVEMGFFEGWGGVIDQLDALLAA